MDHLTGRNSKTPYTGIEDQVTKILTLLKNQMSPELLSVLEKLYQDEFPVERTYGAVHTVKSSHALFLLLLMQGEVEIEGSKDNPRMWEFVSASVSGTAVLHQANKALPQDSQTQKKMTTLDALKMLKDSCGEDIIEAWMITNMNADFDKETLMPKEVEVALKHLLNVFMEDFDFEAVKPWEGFFKLLKSGGEFNADELKTLIEKEWKKTLSVKVSEKAMIASITKASADPDQVINSKLSIGETYAAFKTELAGLEINKEIKVNRLNKVTAQYEKIKSSTSNEVLKAFKSLCIGQLKK